MREGEVREMLCHAIPVRIALSSTHERAMKRARQEDRRYFETHPEQDVHFRHAVPGEFGHLADASKVAFVRVDRLGSDTRIRWAVIGAAVDYE